MLTMKFRAWNGSEMIYAPTYNESIEELFSWGDDKIQQATGIKDINGKDIYDGDIVKMRNQTCNCNGCEYTWSIYLIESKDAGFIYRRLSEQGYGYLSWIASTLATTIEIIGNIYENPELLTK